MRVGEDVVDRRAVMVVDDHRKHGRGERGHVAQHLGAIAHRVDWDGRVLESVLMESTLYCGVCAAATA